MKAGIFWIDFYYWKCLNCKNHIDIIYYAIGCTEVNAYYNVRHISFGFISLNRFPYNMVRRTSTKWWKFYDKYFTTSWYQICQVGQFFFSLVRVYSSQQRSFNTNQLSHDFERLKFLRFCYKLGLRFHRYLLIS